MKKKGLPLRIGLSAYLLVMKLKNLFGGKNAHFSGYFSLAKAIKESIVPSIVNPAQNEYLRLVKEAKDLRNSLEEEENPSLLDGLI